MLGPLQLIGTRVRADAFAWRQVARRGIVVRRVAGAGAASLLLVAFDEPMRVEVVFHDRQPHAASRQDARDDVGDLRVGAGPSPNHIIEPRDHQVADGQAARPESIQQVAQVGLVPGDARSAHEHVIDADLLQAPHSGFVRLRAGPKTDSGRID